MGFGIRELIGKITGYFTESGDNESQRTTNNIGARAVSANKIIDSIIITGNGNNVTVSPQQLDEYREVLRRYLIRLKTRCNVLPLTAMGGGENEQRNTITLENVYIDLDTTTTVSNEQTGDRPEQEAARPGEQRPLKVREAALRSQNMVLLGDPGSGKSTFVKQLVAEAAKALLAEDPDTAPPQKPLLPIFLEIGKLGPRFAALDLQDKSGREQSDIFEDILRKAWLAELEKFQASSLAEVIERRLDDGGILFIFDGLDEVPQAARRGVRRAIGLAATLWPENRLIVTSRIRSYQGGGDLAGFTEYTLASLDDGQVKGFIAGWYGGQVEKGIDRATAESRTADLQRAVADAKLKELAANPMLLTVMAIIHQQKVGLPEERVKLYKCAVEILFHRWQREKPGEALSERLGKIIDKDLKIRPIMEELAFRAHRLEADGRKENLLAREELSTYLEGPAGLGDYALAGEFLDYVDQRAGLLVGHGGEGEGYPRVYGFPHRTFQEYLAGCRMISGRGASIARQYRQLAGESDFWYVAAQLGAEELLYNRFGETHLLDLAYALCPGEADLQNESAQRQHVWSGHMAVLLGVDFIQGDQGPGVNPDEGGDNYLQRLISRLLKIMTGTVLGPLERVEAGRHLAMLGDPREKVLRPEKIEFLEIEPGSFVMGEGDEEYTHTLDYSYAIARYPVTNAQYRVFVEAGGYEEERCWVEAKAAGFWKDGALKGRWDDSPRKQAKDYGIPYNLANHPVVGITWYEALAFCRWLTDFLHEQNLLPCDRQVCLPSEPEWERAVRGREGLVYPWGNEADPDKANYRDTKIGTTNAVGCFAIGASSDGVEEMSGNVWEWTRSLWGNDWENPDFSYPYDPEDGREQSNADPEVLRVVRGGSFANYEYDARGARRYWDLPELENWDWGFRVVFSPSPLKSETLNSDHLEKQR